MTKPEPRTMPANKTPRDSDYLELIDAAGDAIAQLDVLAHLTPSDLVGERDGYGFYLLISGVSGRLKDALSVIPGSGYEIP